MANQDASDTHIGKLLKDRRVSLGLSIQEVYRQTGISGSHLSRIEGDERRPSGQVLQKIAKPLKFEESELMVLAGYLSQPVVDKDDLPAVEGHLDPLVARVLAQEPGGSAAPCLQHSRGNEERGKGTMISHRVQGG